MNVIGTETSTFEFNTLLYMASDNAGSYFALYLTVVSGYLIAAYLAGHNLKDSQVKLINSFFVISALYFAWSTFLNNMAVLTYQLQIPRVPQGLSYFVGATNGFISLIMLIGVFACLRFMRDVRESKHDNDSHS